MVEKGYTEILILYISECLEKGDVQRIRALGKDLREMIGTESFSKFDSRFTRRQVSFFVHRFIHRQASFFVHRFIYRQVDFFVHRFIRRQVSFFVHRFIRRQVRFFFQRFILLKRQNTQCYHFPPDSSKNKPNLKGNLFIYQ